MRKIKFKLDKEEKKEYIKEEPNEDLKPLINEVDNKQGLKSKLEEVNEKLDILTKRNKKTETKEFSLPSKFKKQLKKLALRNKILVIYLTRSKGMLPLVCEIRDGFVLINKTPHQCEVDQVFLWKGKYPSMVVKEWDIQPIGTSDYYEAIENKTLSSPVNIVLRMIENRENIMKNKLSNKAWIFIGLAVIAGLWVLFSGGK
jgi:hypothetical protein